MYHTQPPILTHRERLILQELAQGRPQSKLDSALGISKSEVSLGISSSINKLRAQNIIQAVAIAVHQGLVTPVGQMSSPHEVVPLFSSDPSVTNPWTNTCFRAILTRVQAFIITLTGKQKLVDPLPSLQEVDSLPLSNSPFSSHPWDTLTLREMQIFLLLGDEEIAQMTSKEIAPRLGISEGTLKKHLQQIYEKLGVENRCSAALLAAQVKYFYEEGGAKRKSVSNEGRKIHDI